MFSVSPTNTHILVTVSKGFHTPNLAPIGVPDAHTMPQPGSSTPAICLFCPPFRNRAPPSLTFATRGYSRVAGWTSHKTAPDCCFTSSFSLRLPEIAGLTSRYHIAQRWTPLQGDFPLSGRPLAVAQLPKSCDARHLAING